MSVPSQTSNVIVSSANDTLTGPLWINKVKVNGGSGTSTATITMNSIVVYNSGNVAASTATIADQIDLYIPAGNTATIALTGTSASITLYLRRS